MKVSILLLGLFLLVKFSLAQGPDILWQRATGGNGDDYGNTIVVDDNGYIYLAGSTGTLNNGDVPLSCWQTATNSMQDPWLVKFDSLGNLLWSKCLGLNGVIQDIVRLNNYQFLLTGWEFDQPSNSTDLWIAKIDTSGNFGNLNAIYGGSNTTQYGYSILGLDSNRYLSVGSSNAQFGNGNYDVAIVFSDTLSYSEYVFGGSSDDDAKFALRLRDGNILLVGSTYSNDSDVTNNHGSRDVWVLKIDTVGHLLWQKCFGGSDRDYGSSVVELDNKDLIIGATTESNDGDVDGNHSSNRYDFWIFKIDSSGTLIWQKCFGGSGFDNTPRLISDDFNNIIVLGSASSIDGDVIGNHSTLAPDFWMLKIDTSGTLISSKCFGGSGTDEPSDLIIHNNKIIMTGSTSTNNDGDVTGHHFSPNYGDDAWLVITDTNFVTSSSSSKLNQSSLNVFPNPASNFITIGISKMKNNTNSNAIFYFRDMIGNIISENKIQNFPYEYDVSNLVDGMYSISVITRDKIFYSKIIKN